MNDRTKRWITMAKHDSKHNDRFWLNIWKSNLGVDSTPVSDRQAYVQAYNEQQILNKLQGRKEGCKN